MFEFFYVVAVLWTVFLSGLIITDLKDNKKPSIPKNTKFYDKSWTL